MGVVLETGIAGPAPLRMLIKAFDDDLLESLLFHLINTKLDVLEATKDQLHIPPQLKVRQPESIRQKSDANRERCTLSADTILAMA